MLVFWLEGVDVPPLEQRVRELVLRKAKKLAPHGAAGRTRTLLLESVDGINMSAERMLEVIRSAFGGVPDGIDQLWFVDSGFNLEPEFIDFTPLSVGASATQHGLQPKAAAASLRCLG